MRQKRKLSGEDVLRRVRGQKNQNDVETLQDQHQQSINNQFDDQFQNVDITNSSSYDDSFDASLSPNEVQPQQKEEGPLLVIVKGKNNISLIILFTDFFSRKILRNYSFSM